MVYLEALETVDAENRGRKEESIDDVVACRAAMMIEFLEVETLLLPTRKSSQLSLSKING